MTYSSRIKVLRRSLILVADEFDQFLIEHDLMTDPHGEGLRVRLRVIDRDIDFHVAEVRAPPAFDQLALFRQRATEYVEPTVFSKPNGFHNQRIFFPVAH